MQKRLVSQNVIQCNSQSSPQFASYGPLIAYQTSSGIKIQCIGKEIKQFDIKTNKTFKKMFFKCCNKTDLLYLTLEYAQQTIDIYQVQIIGIQIKTKLHQTINGKNIAPIKHGIAYLEKDVLKALYLQNSQIKTICSCTHQTQILQHQGQDIIILSPLQQQPQTKLLRIFHEKVKGDYQQSPLTIDYIKSPVAIFKNQFIFQNVKQNKEIEIYNINESKMIGKFSYEGQILKIFIKTNILLIITSKENMDRYCFYMLNDDDKTKNLLSHRCVYEKGKGSYFGVFNCLQPIANSIVQAKSGQITIKNLLPQQKQQNQMLIIYVLPAKKSKIEITLVSTSTIKQQTFQQNQTNKIIINKTQIKNKGGISQNKIKSKADDLQIQGARIRTSVQHRKHDNSVEEIQRKMIDHIVGIKINGVLKKFEDLQNRLVKIENQITHIYQKIEKSIENINRQQIKKNVQNLFDRVTPQFQSYFKQVFTQISGVLDQGMNYYSSKLNKQSEIHREAFNQIVHMTFDATQEIIQLGKEELGFSEKISNTLQKIAKVREKLAQDIQETSEQLKNPKLTPQTSSSHTISLTQNEQSPDKRTPNRKKK